MTDTRHLALFGQPVARSLSPRIHRAFAAQAGIPVEYQLLECAPGGLAAALESFRAADGCGCNITMPLKQEAFRLATELSPAARQAGAVNTLRWNDDGDLCGHNTDGDGLVAMLQAGRWPLRGADLLVLGAGGVVRGIVPALLAAGAARVRLHNRDLQRAQALVDELSSLGALALFEATQAGPPPDLVINATAAGHHGALPDLFTEQAHAQGLLSDWLQDSAALVDLNYGPAASPLRQWAGKAGWRFDDGLGMLVQQAALAFESWFGLRPETSAIQQQLSAEL